MSYIDYTYINEIKRIQNKTGTQILIRLIQIYLKKSETSMSTIITHFKNQNFEELRKEIHKFKSSSGNLGVIEVYQTCISIEKELGPDPVSNYQKLSDLVAQLQTQIVPAAAELNEFIKTEMS